MLKIHQSAYDQLRQHSKAAYPDECCGILAGTAIRVVTEAIPARNASDHPSNHYVIAPLDLIRIQKSANLAGQEILGFYHSHPNHPAQPSATDLAEAHWLGSSYLITSVRNGHAAETHAFYLAGATEDHKRFEAEEIQILP